jgi:hypothetical protein
MQLLTGSIYTFTSFPACVWRLFSFPYGYRFLLFYSSDTVFIQIEAPGLIFFDPSLQGVSIGDGVYIRDGASISRSMGYQNFRAKSMIVGDFQCKYLT